jgi:hypothetical protein
MKKCLFIILVLMSFENSKAQKIELGGEIGYGRTTFSHNLYLKLLSEQTDARNINADVNASFKLGSLDFWLITGVGFKQMRDNGTQLNFLHMPLGFDITPGKKVRFLIGSGLYVRYLFSVSVTESDLYKNFTNDFQFGLYVDTGVKYQVTNNWNIYLKLQGDFDMSALYTASLWHHGDVPEHEDVRSYGYTLNIGCRYMIR